MTDLENLEKMLTNAGIQYEKDDKTYQNKIIVRVLSYSTYSTGYKKDRIISIFDFFVDGGLITVS